jgi:K+-transporting ATPase ATPase A chain
MHDSYTPLGGMAPLLLMQFGEVVFGGVGTGICGMLIFVILTALIGGLMIGRTPEYLGKKLGPFETKMAALVILIPILLTLLGTAAAILLPAGRAGIFNHAEHGLTEVLYNFSSACNNNGSAFAGMSLITPFYNLTLAALMFICRFWTIIPLLALAGALARNRKFALGGSLPTHTPLFVGLLVCVTVIIGALSYLPALALGPIAEHLRMVSESLKGRMP